MSKGTIFKSLCGFIVSLFASLANGQTVIDKFSFGQYIQNNGDTNLLFRGQILLREDSVFIYESVGKIKDRASGKFTLIKDTVIFLYSDGYNESSFKQYDSSGKSFPIELVGIRTTMAGRPLKLLFRKDRLHFIPKIGDKKLGKDEFYFIHKP